MKSIIRTCAFAITILFLSKATSGMQLLVALFPAHNKPTTSWIATTKPPTDLFNFPPYKRILNDGKQSYLPLFIIKGDQWRRIGIPLTSLMQLDEKQGNTIVVKNSNNPTEVITIFINQQLTDELKRSFLKNTFDRTEQ